MKSTKETLAAYHLFIISIAREIKSENFNLMVKIFVILFENERQSGFIAENC